MVEHDARGGCAHYFSLDEITSFRGHGAKPTLTALAMKLGVDRKNLRDQGGWRGDKEDLMPDTYATEAQVLALALQERCLRHLRAGHDSLLIETVPRENDVAPARGKFPSSPGDLIDKFDYLWKNPGESAENEMHSGSVEATTEESGVWMGAPTERMQSE